MSSGSKIGPASLACFYYSGFIKRILLTPGNNPIVKQGLFVTMFVFSKDELVDLSIRHGESFYVV